MFKGEKKYVICNSGMLHSTDDIIYRTIIIDNTICQEDHNDTSAYWYHKDIATIIEDPEVTRYLTERDDFIRDSYPPCVVVSYKPEHDKELRDVLLRKYGLTFNGTTAPKLTRTEKTTEQLQHEFVSERAKLLTDLISLMDEGVITELHLASGL